MSKKSDLEHALHNEEVFNHLLTNKNFVDWIITTAFYSALHFVDSKLFPKKIIEKTVQISLNDMDSYAVSALNKYGSDKHIIRLKMVERELRPISSEFSWLFTNCNTARYRNYKFADNELTCKLAEENLKAIKDFVTKK